MSRRVVLNSRVEDVDPAAVGPVRLVVTSPPYMKRDGYSDALMAALGRLLRVVLEPGGRVFFNFGQLSESYRRPFTAAGIVADESGLEFGQTIVWVKSLVVPSWRERARDILSGPGTAEERVAAALDALASDGVPTQRGHFQPITSPSKLNYCWEPVFTLHRPPEPAFDRLAVGVPYSDKRNLGRDTRGKHGDVHCAGDVWFVPYDTTGAKAKKAHRHQFPPALVDRCIAVSGVRPPSRVLDPFSGGGTVTERANAAGLDAVAIDRDPAACVLLRDEQAPVLRKVRPGVYLVGSSELSPRAKDL